MLCEGISSSTGLKVLLPVIDQYVICMEHETAMWILVREVTEKHVFWQVVIII